VNALLGELIEKVVALTRADGAIFVTRHEQVWRTEKVLGVLVGHPGAYRTYPGGMVEHAATAGHPVRLHELKLGAELQEILDSKGVRDALAVPLISELGATLGVFVLHALAPDYFALERQAQATSMAAALVAVLQRRESPELAELNRVAVVEENELRFRAFMSALPALAWEKDEQGRYLFVNQRMRDLYHQGRSIIGQDDFSYLAEPVAKTLRANDDEVRAGAMVLNREEEVPTPDGVAHTWLTTKFPIVAPNGRVSIGGIAVDITEKRASEFARRAAQHELEHLVDLLIDPVTISRKGVLVYANQALGQLLGIPREQLVGRDLRDFLQPGELSAFEHQSAYLSDGQASSWERRMRRSDGTTLLVDVRGRQITFGGEPAVLAVLRDMTQRRAEQQRLQLTDRLASIGTLAAGVAHEINNPLSYVLSNLSLMAERLRPGAPDELHELASEAHDGAQRIMRIVAGMRTLARPTDPKRAVLSLADAVGHAVDLTGNELKHRARLELALGPMPRVLGDETALVQVFVNLLTNAAQAIPAGDEAQHLVRITGRTLPDGQAQVSVQDDGVGIAPDVLARVFDPFFTTKPVNFGTGLGLTVSHGIIASHGGELSVASELGKGATFSVTLPAAVVPRQARVLVVDDDELVARSLSRLLAAHQVTVASSARGALELLGAHTYDLVLCDVMMPGISGPALQAKVPTDVAARFVFITGGAFTAEAQAFLDQVKNPVLGKPIDRARLVTLVEQSIAG
jgi:PAS domain S-box-containing protein